MIEAFRSLFAPPRHFILVFIAIWAGLSLAEKQSERHGVSKDQLNNIAFYSLFGYIIGGRVLFALANISAFTQSPLSIISPNPNLFDPTSGLITAILVAFIYGQRQKLQLWQTLDALTPLFAILAIGLSLSHLAAGTAFGSPTTLPWGIELWNATRHPTQIYELLASLLIFGLVWSRKSDSPPGILVLNFAALTAGSRLIFEAFHGDSTLILGGIRLTQITTWITLAVVLFMSEKLKQRKASMQ
jgi:phosphatidylglycerol---prolipoprotein diacylglyceryl transferase